MVLVQFWRFFADFEMKYSLFSLSLMFLNWLIIHVDM